VKYNLLPDFEIRCSKKSIWLGRSRRRWEVIIKMNFEKIVCEDGTWMKVAKESVKWAVRGL
jgi:hypothetical protein